MGGAHQRLANGPQPLYSAYPPMADPIIIPASAGYGDYLAIAVVAGLAIALVAGILTTVWLMTRVVARIGTRPEKSAPYECGEEPIGPAWQRFNLRFYLVAIIFLVFDVELALILPTLPLFAPAIAGGHGWLVFAKIFLFVATLLLGLVYAAAKGDFSWDKTVAAARRRGGRAP